MYDSRFEKIKSYKNVNFILLVVQVIHELAM